MKAGFLDRLIERLDRLDPQSVQTHFLRLAQEKGLLDAIFQSIQEGVIVVDGAGRIAYANRAAEQYLGFEREAVTGKPIPRFLRGIAWDRILSLDEQEWSKLVRHEIEVTYPERRFLSFYVVPLFAEGSSEKGLVIMLRDVTRDREHEASALESERLQAVRLLAAGVAHEIGNPLNALTIHLQLLDREIQKLPEGERGKLTDLVRIARDEIARLDLIVTQFLRALRPSRPHLAPTRLDAVIQETLTLLKQDIEDRRIEVSVETPSGLPRVRVDRDQIKQAFFNIAKNALQAMPDGGALQITLMVTDRYVGAAFRDTGPGIAPDDFGRIFEPYFTTKSQGSGLGLMIVQRIVQDHGGRLDVRSDPGAGTTFTVWLPLFERRVRLLKASERTDAAEKEESVS